MCATRSMCSMCYEERKGTRSPRINLIVSLFGPMTRFVVRKTMLMCHTWECLDGLKQLTSAEA